MATLDKDLLNEWLSTMVRVFVGAGMTPADFAAAVVADVGDAPDAAAVLAALTAHIADETAAHAGSGYNVHVLSTGAVGTGGRINTNIPATYGAYQVNFQYVVGQGSRPATGRFYFRVFNNSGSPGLTDVYGSTSGADIQTMRVEISGGLLVFHIYGSYYDIFFNIKSSVAISSAALEGWTVAAYADNGTVVERVNYSRDTQYFSSVGADNYVTSPLIGKSIFGPFCPLHKVDASAPTTGSDTSANFKVGDLWTDTATSRLYVCLDATNGAAVWKYTALT